MDRTGVTLVKDRLECRAELFDAFAKLPISTYGLGTNVKE